MTMTTDELNAIDAREKAATKGPWKIVATGDSGGKRVVVGIAAQGAIRSPDIPDATCEFIAQSREDVPSLVAEVRRLRGMCEEYEASVKERDAYRSAFQAVIPHIGGWHIGEQCVVCRPDRRHDPKHLDTCPVGIAESLFEVEENLDA